MKKPTVDEIRKRHSKASPGVWNLVGSTWSHKKNGDLVISGLSAADTQLLINSYSDIGFLLEKMLEKIEEA